MCGFFVSITKHRLSDDVKSSILRDLHARGPDATGIEELYFNHKFITFIHSRLSIINPDSKFNQPLAGDSSLIAYNGMLYNYRQLLHHDDSITSPDPNTSCSDTKVLLDFLDANSTNLLNKLYGMFAFVYLSRKTQSLSIVRDQSGIKPLFI